MEGRPWGCSGSSWWVHRAPFHCHARPPRRPLGCTPLCSWGPGGRPGACSMSCPCWPGSRATHHSQKQGCRWGCSRVPALSARRCLPPPWKGTGMGAPPLCQALGSQASPRRPERPLQARVSEGVGSGPLAVVSVCQPRGRAGPQPPRGLLGSFPGPASAGRPETHPLLLCLGPGCRLQVIRRPHPTAVHEGAPARWGPALGPVEGGCEEGVGLAGLPGVPVGRGTCRVAAGTTWPQNLISASLSFPVCETVPAPTSEPQLLQNQDQHVLKGPLFTMLPAH